MEKANGKIDVGTQVMVLSAGNEGKYGIVRQNLGFHKEEEEFTIPVGGPAHAHRTDQWWWVEGKDGTAFNLFVHGTRMKPLGSFGMAVEIINEKRQQGTLFFPDKELMPLPPIDDDTGDLTDTPVRDEHPNVLMDL